jgi:formylmethanofuran dehydrogenase subunit B
MGFFDLAMAASVVEDVACTVCGCVCDDLRLHVASGQIERVENDCPLARPWFDAVRNAPVPPAAAIEGRIAALEDAAARAADILARASSPLIYGLSRSSTEGQRAACRLADQLGATIDTTASLCHAPSIMALQAVGESTSSLGEIRHRCDLVIYWGSDPLVSHPRHLERYSVDAPGMFAGSAASRTLAVVDVRKSATAQRADLFVKLAPGSDFDAIWMLRLLLRGTEPDAGATDRLPMAELRDLAQRMKTCKSGAVYFGRGLATRSLGHANVEALLRLVTDLNAYTRFYARRMRVYGDVAGADSVLCWQTGYPFSVNLARGYPRFGPNEYSADVLLSRGEVDACLLVGSEGIEPLSDAAKEHLARIPTIVLDYPHVRSPIEPTVRFTTAIYGIHRSGTAYRMDEVPIPLKRVLDSPFPSDGEVLRAIASRAVHAPTSPAADGGAVLEHSQPVHSSPLHSMRGTEE